MKHISIPKPCLENWNAMTPVDQGRFCASCEKTVYDFTRSSDTEILNVMSGSGNVCGRFLKSQLGRELIAHKEKSSSWAIAASGILGMLSVASAQAQAENPSAVLMIGESFSEVETASQPTLKGEIDNSPSWISGVVSDPSGPLPGAIVKVKETGAGTQTDVDGKYAIAVFAGQTLEFSFIGLADEHVRIDSSKTCDVQLRESAIGLGEIVVSGKSVFERPNLVKRTYYRIRNWFR
ncbi:carboxypeptidase-like regulatory domain-containing protein [Flavobacterium selenitireducens]|uniref:carboxypeptidase-like regulatory domain-containing protein n=1 Tax=Flavobacterium selenitireducens TaxID=2722704 RepID=UPI00168BD996|nr:carboxypeptidase-like regulatory domain-containing protein [Flavobacterium selenitireducens]MBD3581188.1 hypothetical protein [Flavobacterium selenitireducens]